MEQSGILGMDAPPAPSPFRGDTARSHDLYCSTPPIYTRLPDMKVVVIIPAAGLGTRMSALSGGPKSKSKQFFELQGTPILVHTLRKFAACDAVSEIVVALRKNEAAGFQKQIES